MNFDKILEISQTLCGTQGRIDYVEHLYEVASLLPENCTVLEIGTQMGGSATVLALTIKERGGKLHCIDPCFVEEHKRPKEYLKYYGTVSGYSKDYVIDTFKKYDINDIVTLHAGSSEEILETIDKNILFDMVFIDGCHQYRPVKIDLKWLERTKDDAIVMFDDWIVPVKQAADEYFTEHTNWKNMTDGSFFPIWFQKQKKGG